MQFCSAVGAVNKALAVFVGIVVLGIILTDGEPCDEPIEVDPSAIQKSRRLMNKSFLTVPINSLVECAAFCHRYHKCETFNLNTKDKQCELNEPVSDDGTYDENDAWQHANKLAWQPPLNLKGCANHKCGEESGCFDIVNIGPECVPFPVDN